MMLRHTLSYQAPRMDGQRRNCGCNLCPLVLRRAIFQATMPTNGWQFTQSGVGFLPIASG